MISKEEYQKTLIRMWDSLRDKKHKGEFDCAGVNCGSCPINFGCGSVMRYSDVIEFVEKWGKEHPIKTNGSEFLKTHPNTDVCGYKDNGKILFIRLDNSKPSNADDNMIEVPAEWWNKEVE